MLNCVYFCLRHQIRIKSNCKISYSELCLSPFTSHTHSTPSHAQNVLHNAACMHQTRSTCTHTQNSFTQKTHTHTHTHGDPHCFKLVCGIQTLATSAVLCFDINPSGIHNGAICGLLAPCMNAEASYICLQHHYLTFHVVQSYRYNVVHC